MSLPEATGGAQPFVLPAVFPAAKKQPLPPRTTASPSSRLSQDSGSMAGNELADLLSKRRKASDTTVGSGSAGAAQSAASEPSKPSSSSARPSPREVLLPPGVAAGVAAGKPVAATPGGQQMAGKPPPPPSRKPQEYDSDGAAVDAEEKGGQHVSSRCPPPQRAAPVRRPPSRAPPARGNTPPTEDDGIYAVPAALQPPPTSGAKPPPATLLKKPPSSLLKKPALPKPLQAATALHSKPSSAAATSAPVGSSAPVVGRLKSPFLINQGVDALMCANVCVCVLCYVFLRARAVFGVYPLADSASC